MARQLRIEYPGAFYHVTSRGNERKPVFKSKRDREKFLVYLESASERYEAVIHVYCLMDNHYHLLIETPAGNLSQIMQHINGAYTTYFNVKRQRSGHLFQGRYKSILVQADEYAKELSRYIHLNPVRVGIAETPEEYEWSSYSYYAVRKEKPAWLSTDFILGYFGEKHSVAQRNYKDYASSLLEQEYKNPLSDISYSAILGISDFVNEIRDKFFINKKHDRNLPVLKEITNRLSMDAISKGVDSIVEKNDKLARQMKLFLCHRYSGIKLSEIGACFDLGESGVSQTSRHFSEKLKKDEKVRKTTELVKKKLNM
jgi:REP element-mobilizing transposase RayT